MKKFLIYTSMMLLTLSACQKSNKTNNDKAVNDSIATVVTDNQVKDSTIYGKADEFGMSTFTLITTEGDTLYLTRTDSNGKDGKIYGSLREDDRYALTTCDNNQAINTLINLTQLEKNVKDYTISNGRLIINKDTVEIEKLTDSVIQYK